MDNWVCCGASFREVVRGMGISRPQFRNTTPLRWPPPQMCDEGVAGHGGQIPVVSRLLCLRLVPRMAGVELALQVVGCGFSACPINLIWYGKCSQMVCMPVGLGVCVHGRLR